MKLLNQEEAIKTIQRIKRIGRKEAIKMNKKLGIGIVIGIIIIIIGLVGYVIYKNTQGGSKLQAEDTKIEMANEEEEGREDKKVLVVYYSA